MAIHENQVKNDLKIRLFDASVLTFVVGPVVGDFEGNNEGALESANVGEELGFPSAQIAVTSIFKYI